jgi:hypothetical protein
MTMSVAGPAVTFEFGQIEYQPPKYCRTRSRVAACAGAAAWGEGAGEEAAVWPVSPTGEAAHKAAPQARRASLDMDTEP